MLEIKIYSDEDQRDEIIFKGSVEDFYSDLVVAVLKALFKFKEETNSNIYEVITTFLSILLDKELINFKKL